MALVTELTLEERSAGAGPDTLQVLTPAFLDPVLITGELGGASAHDLVSHQVPGTWDAGYCYSCHCCVTVVVWSLTVGILTSHPTGGHTLPLSMAPVH